jgi:hypothetical protein
MSQSLSVPSLTQVFRLDVKVVLVRDVEVVLVGTYYLSFPVDMNMFFEDFTLEEMVELLHSSGEDLEHDFDALQSRVDATSLMLGRGFANISAILLNSLPDPKDAVRKLSSRYQFTQERRHNVI